MPCAENCATCDANNVCLSCKSGLFKMGTNKCEKYQCPKDCATCTEHQCLDCTTGTLVDGKCINIVAPSNCNDAKSTCCNTCNAMNGQINVRQRNGVCEEYQCSPLCTTCTDKGCTACDLSVTNNSLNDQTKACEIYECPDNCKVCSDKETCTECVNNTTLFLDANGKCVPLVCPSNCSDCTNPTTCTACEDESLYTLTGGQCQCNNEVNGECVKTSNVEVEEEGAQEDELAINDFYYPADRTFLEVTFTGPLDKFAHQMISVSLVKQGEDDTPVTGF